MYWLGHDPVAVRQAEIGARPHYFKKNHQTEHDFEFQMRRCFALLASVMRPLSYACFVVGDSIIHGRLIDNAALLARAATDAGFTAVATVTRPVATSRKSFNLSHARLKEEAIVVFRLQGRPR
jgi:site-specific DNA-methyltransferase (cytosine-N4-specific)